MRPSTWLTVTLALAFGGACIETANVSSGLKIALQVVYAVIVIGGGIWGDRASLRRDDRRVAIITGVSMMMLAVFVFACVFAFFYLSRAIR